jgi:hypothetical protein
MFWRHNMKQFLVMVACGISLIANAADNKNTAVTKQSTVSTVSYRCSIRDNTCFESRSPATRALRRLK